MSLRVVFVAFVLAVAGCGHSRAKLASTQSPLSLSRVVLYRNGVGYFERHGAVDGDRLSIKVRKDQVNDLLKSLTIIDRGSGKALSVSMPLDPQGWQDAALAMLMPGRGRLAEVLDGLRGTQVVVETKSRTARGRIVMVEPVAGEPAHELLPREPVAQDHKLTLLDGAALQVVRLSEVETIGLRQGELVMQLDRHLDASAGEGMFQQVDVVVRLAEAGKHDLLVSYVVAAPVWKPTYRLVLDEDNPGKALLQAWAVVSNVSGENWEQVALGLTSGAPLAFRYDLHTPENVERPDLTQSGVHKRAAVSLGESSYGEESPSRGPDNDPLSSLDLTDGLRASGAQQTMKSRAGGGTMAASPRPAPAPPALDMGALAQSVVAQATAKRIAGLTRFDIDERVSLPDGSASMVVLVNELVPGEQTFLYKPGGSGQGYEQNPYRVVRFENTTDFVLEPGPISVYAGGSFVGEGLSEAIASRGTATIPFAAEPSIVVRSSTEASGDEMKIVRVVRGVMEVEAFRRLTTSWQVQGKPSDAGYRVLVRQPRAAHGYELVAPPKGTEILADGYLVPIVVAPKQSEAKLELVEQTPSKLSLTIWDSKAPELLARLLETPGLDAKSRSALTSIVALRQEIGRIDTESSGLRAQQAELDSRAREYRENLLAIQKDARGADLRKRLSERLEELTKDADTLARKLVELASTRLARKIELEDMLRDLDLTPSQR